MKEREKINSGEMKKDHVGKNMLQWNEKECIYLVNSYPDGKEINFSKLAREHCMMNKNGEFPKKWWTNVERLS